jgi:predicted nucleic acid-binding protein
MMTRTFLDSGVLIAASRADADQSHPAMRVIADPERLLLTSVFVRLEVYPKAKVGQFPTQRAFLNEFFMDPSVLWAKDLNMIVQIALGVAEDHGLSAMDAMHIAAALMLDAQQFVTTEKQGRSVYRVSGRVEGLQVVHVNDAAGSKPEVG